MPQSDVYYTELHPCGWMA